MGFGLLSADAGRMMIIASQAAQGFVQTIDAP
jgi:hypothetical protein